MQIVIDIPDNMQDMCQWHKDGICALTGIEVDMIAEAIAKGMTFPDNATNGDVIKALFPDSELNKESDYVYLTISRGVYLEDRNATWWNAPYKEAENE